jgi:hypothetical protein
MSDSSILLLKQILIYTSQNWAKEAPMLFLSGKTGKTMNSDHTTRRLVPSFFFMQNDAVLE